MYHNIEKSSFKPGDYVGYGLGSAWRIRKTVRNQSESYFGKWIASEQSVQRWDPITPRRVFANTLRELSAKLDA
jgi:hypothetical protein